MQIQGGFYKGCNIMKVAHIYFMLQCISHVETILEVVVKMIISCAKFI